jgi:hypothetical protein
VATVRAGRLVVAAYVDARVRGQGPHPLDQEPVRTLGVGHGHHVSGLEPPDGADEEPVPGREGGEHAVAGHHDTAKAAEEESHGHHEGRKEPSPGVGTVNGLTKHGDGEGVLL